MTDPLHASDPLRLGPYRLHARLGGGGMGQVYLGRSPGGHTVAVKAVRPELADDPDFRRRFGVEITAARRVGGLYTAQVVDADPDGDPPWLATAYIPGPSLHRAVTDRGPLPPGSVVALGAGLAEGLTAVHSHDLVHRDLKPANVILSAGGPRLIDFGIARALDTTSHTRTSTVLGTAAFMSPEQATAEKQIGFASDVFSLGCVLAFAATGHSPFGEGPAHAVVYRVVHADPDLGGVPASLTDLIGACLAKTPGERPSLEELLRGLAFEAPSEHARPGGEGSWLPEDLTEVINQHETLLLTLVEPEAQSEQTPPPPPPPPRGTPRAAPRTPPAGAPELVEMTTALSRITERARTVLSWIAGVAALFVVLALGGFLVGSLTSARDITIDGAFGFATDVLTSTPFAFLLVIGFVLNVLDSGSLGHDLLVVDQSGLKVVDQRWLRLRNQSFSLSWEQLRSVKAIASYAGSSRSIAMTVAVEFGDGHKPEEKWLKRHRIQRGDGGLVVARTDTADASEKLYRLREALIRFGGDIHVYP